MKGSFHMNNTTAKVTKGVMAGMAIGTAVGMATVGMIKVKRKPKFRKAAQHSLEAIGSVIQSVADITR